MVTSREHINDEAEVFTNILMSTARIVFKHIFVWTRPSEAFAASLGYISRCRT
jgi:hypothetical protein